MNETQEKLNQTVRHLEVVVNNYSVNGRMIREAFLKIHPPLLNEIAKGVLMAAKHRETDGRIQMHVLKMILEED